MRTLCYYSKEEGHLIKHCPKKKKTYQKHSFRRPRNESTNNNKQPNLKISTWPALNKTIKPVVSTGVWGDTQTMDVVKESFDQSTEKICEKESHLVLKRRLKKSD